MKKLQALKSRLMGVVLLAGLILYGCKGSQPQNLPFQAIALDVGGLSYMQEQPNLLIITAPEEVDTPGLEIQFPSALADQLRQLDYDRFFTILVLQGLKRQGGYSVTVQEVSRQHDQVIVRADFVSPAPGTRRTQAFTSPYHLVAVSKEGSWGQQVRFMLVVNDAPVAETTHIIPP